MMPSSDPTSAGSAFHREFAGSGGGLDGGAAPAGCWAAPIDGLRAQTRRRVVRNRIVAPERRWEKVLKAASFRGGGGRGVDSAAYFFGFFLIGTSSTATMNPIRAKRATPPKAMISLVVMESSPLAA